MTVTTLSKSFAALTLVSAVGAVIAAPCATGALKAFKFPHTDFEVHQNKIRTI